MKRIYHDLDDEELVNLNQLGDPQAFNEIVYRYESYIQAKCLSFIKDAESAKDLSQEILIKIFFELPNFRKEARLKTWIYAICYHTCIDFLRKSKIKVHRYISEKLADHVPELMDEEVENLGTARRMDLLEQVLDQMTPEGKLILLMKYVEKQSIKDIQLAMDLSESAIKMRLKRARSVLNQLYKQEERKG